MSVHEGIGAEGGPLARLLDAEGREIPLARELVTCGRGEDNVVVLHDASVSRYHARLERGPGGWTVVDPGSTNGTFVNRERVSPGQPRALRDGDRLAFGDCEFEYRVAPQVETTVATPVVSPPESREHLTQQLFVAVPEIIQVTFAVIQARGVLNAETIESVLSECRTLVEQNALRILIEMREVDYIDSSAVGGLVRLQAELMAVDGSIGIVAPSPAVRRVIEQLNLATILPLYEEKGQALGTAQSPAPAERGGTEPRVLAARAGNAPHLVLPGGQEWPLAERAVSLGSEVGNDILIDDPGVAPQHARIVHVGERFVLLDGPGGAATILNGEPVRDLHVLNHGDEIRLGRSVFRFYGDGDGTEKRVVSPGIALLRFKELPLEGRELTIGRSAENALVINDDRVSSEHAKIIHTDGGYWLLDLGSSNGTFVNEQRIPDVHLLNHGDVIALGATTLAFERRAVRIEETSRGPLSTVAKAEHRDEALIGRPTDPLARLGENVFRLRWPILIAWLVVLGVAGALLAPKASHALKGGGFIDPDSESARAASILDKEFNASTFTSAVAVFRSPALTVDDSVFRDQVSSGAEQLSRVHGVRNVQTFYSSGNPALISPDRHTTLALIPLEGDEGQVQELVPELRAALNNLTIDHYVTGTPAVNNDLQVTSEKDLQRSEVFTIPIVLILLLLVFRTVPAALLPLAIGAGSIVLALSGLYLVSTQTPVSIFALNVTTMIGLGLGIDFSLLMANRFREELASGRAPQEAVAVTMATAGRSILYSALTVLLAMFVLTLLFNLLIVRSISLGVMMVAFTGLIAGLTLLPAVLGILGHRIEWLRVVPRRKPRDDGQAGFWYRLSHAIMARPWAWLAVSLAVLFVLAAPVRELTLYGATADIMPSSVESTRSVKVVSDAFGQSRLTPVQIILTSSTRNGVWRPEFLDAVKRVSDWSEADARNDEVFSLTVLARTAGIPEAQFRSITLDSLGAVPPIASVLPQFVNSNGNNDTTVITVFSKYDRFSKEHESFIQDLRGNILPGIRQAGAVSNAYVGGDGAIFLDFRDATARRLPYLVAGVTIVTFFMLMMFFQSVFLPIKAILMNLTSILATYGVLVLIFQYGWGDKYLGFSSLGGLGMFAPAILFAILFGLSTDYEVFMLSRVKEFYHESGNNEEAVARGLQNTAAVITAAGLILVGTFGSFATAEVVAIKEIGIGLAIGVLIDSTIVRVIMVPATMRLMGGANWWMPGWLRRIVPELREGPALSPAA